MNNNGLAYIGGQPYSVRLMTGGQNRHDTDNEWNQKLLSFADAKERFHTKEMFNGIKIPLILTRCFARTAGAIRPASGITTMLRSSTRTSVSALFLSR